jgi:predicted transcriptional regulator
MIEFRNTGYYVTKHGEIIGKKKTLKPTITPYGYFSVCLYYERKYKTFLVHRMIGECYLQNTDNKPEINHLDGNKLNNELSNLEWSTKKQNIEHFYKKISKRKHGEHPNSKLSYQDMQEIYKYVCVDNIYIKKIAEKYNVSKSTIYHAINSIKNEMKNNR